jgi:hypothetical protein
MVEESHLKPAEKRGPESFSFAALSRASRFSECGLPIQKENRASALQNS